MHLSVDTSSLDLLRLCRERGALYIDTVVEPWAGFYFDLSQSTRARSNYALREAVRAEAQAHPGGPTAVSCCGANPGMVSWLLKEALLKLATDLGQPVARPPAQRPDWARLMQSLGVKGVHIAERDTQASHHPKPIGTFVNTWSVEGFVAEAFQPAELGWGTHERWVPPNSQRHADGCRAAIYLDTPGLLTKVHTWTPAAGPQYGFLVTHNEAISIADYYSVGTGDAPEFRPTCLYAYHPCDDAVLSLHETLGSGRMQERMQILDEHQIVRGADHLGVLLYGHAKNALWYGSRLTIEADTCPGAVPERDRAAGHVRGGCGHGLGAAPPGRRHRRDRRDRPRGVPACPAPVPGRGRGALHRLDADRHPLATVRRGHRRQRSVAVPQCAGDLSARAAWTAGNDGYRAVSTDCTPRENAKRVRNAVVDLLVLTEREAWNRVRRAFTTQREEPVDADGRTHGIRHQADFRFGHQR